MREQCIKECKHHGLTVFKERKDTRHKGTSWRCTKCEYESVVRRRKKLKKDLVEYHGGCCIKCGYSKSLRALSFHHRNPEEKSFTIATGTIIAWEKLLEESKKCDLLCANCHMEIEDGP